MPLITIQQLANYLKIDLSDEAEVEFLEIVVAGVQATVENYCHRKFDITKYTGEQHTVNHKLFPYNYPIVSVERITRYEAGVPEENTTEQDSYRVYPNYIDLLDYQYVTMSGKLKYANSEPSLIVLDYTAGYSVTPSDLLLATLKLASLEFKESRENRLGVDNEREGQVAYTYSKRDTDIPLSIARVLDRYKAVRL